MLESLKTGKNYFAVSEWKAVPDLSKKTPQIRSEPVARRPAAADRGRVARGARRQDKFS